MNFNAIMTELEAIKEYCKIENINTNKIRVFVESDRPFDDVKAITTLYNGENDAIDVYLECHTVKS